MNLKYVLLIAAIILSACSAPKTLNDLSTPSYAWSSGDGLCGLLYAADKNGTIWRESGCEGSSSGFEKVATLDSSRFVRLEAAFTELPENAQVPFLDCGPTSTPDIFTYTTAESETNWLVCPTSERELPSETSVLPEPYQEIAAILSGKQ